MSKEERSENQKIWKEKVGYGRRWLVGISFSAFKRLFGEDVRAIKVENIIQEVMIKVAAYNKFVMIGMEGT